MRLGKQCRFEDIEVGEVFASGGCCNIWYKQGANTCISLANDWSRWHGGDITSAWRGNIWAVYEIYKLPQHVQEYWINS